MIAIVKSYAGSYSGVQVQSRDDHLRIFHITIAGRRSKDAKIVWRSIPQQEQEYQGWEKVLA